MTGTGERLFYYGWLVLAASAVAEMIAIGATSYSAGLFVLPLQAEFHLSRADANSSVLLIFLGGVPMVPFAGRVLDTWPIRQVMTLGALALAGALVMIALASSVWVMALALLLPGALGFVLLGPLTTSTLTARWFERRRGLALGIAAIATSGGGIFVVQPLRIAIAHFGWRMALLYEASAIAVIVTALAFFILRDSPASMGLAGHRENTDAKKPVPISLLRHWKEILGSSGFWAPSLLLASISGIAEGIVITAVPYGAHLGFSAEAAALLISAFSLAAALTKILAGVVSDWLDKRVPLLIATLAMVLSLALLRAFSGYGMVMLSACLAGVALGGVLPTSAALIATRFGPSRFGATMGWTYAMIGILTIASVRVAGAVFDATGGYAIAFDIFLGFSVLTALAALGLETAFARRKGKAG